MRSFSLLAGAVFGAVLAWGVHAPACANPAITIVGAPKAEPRTPFTVLTTMDFTGPAGPGEAWRQGFEATCGCTVVYKTVDDPLALSPTLRLGGDGGADVVLGLPAPSLEEARASARFAPHRSATAPSLPVAWRDEIFLPVAFGWVGLIYDTARMKRPPVSWREIADARAGALRVAIPDPHVSANGLDAVLWLRATQKSKAGAIWAAAKSKITIAPGAGAALAMLERGEVDMALASASWPARRAIAEGVQRFGFAPFREGQFLQVESAAILKGAPHPQIAAAFLAFLASAPAQSQIAPRRGLYPVNLAAALPEAFSRLAPPSASVSLHGKTIEEQRDAWLAEWDRAMGR